jgi:hypothetical protein
MGGGVVRRDRTKLWRCEVCGKWSHAKRRPRRHRRFIANVEGWRDEPDVDGAAEAERLGLAVVQVVDGYYNGDPDDDGDPGGVWVACGPFETWVATRVIKDKD